MIGRVNVAGRGEGPAPGPAYSVEKWCKVVGLTYSDISDITEADMRKLMSKHVSVDYFMEWYASDNAMLDDFTQSEIAMKWIGLNDYIADKLLAIADAESRLLASEFWKYILKDHVPIMTSNTDPYGEVFCSKFASGYNDYFAFDGNASSCWYSNESASETYIGYKFTNPTRINRAHLRANAFTGITYITSYSIWGSQDKINWDLLGEHDEQFNGYGGHDIDLSWQNSKYYLYYEVRSTNTTVYPYTSDMIYALQFYGRSLTVSETSAPTEKPYLQVGSVYYTVDYSDRTERNYLYDCGLEFDNNFVYEGKSTYASGTASMTKEDTYLDAKAVCDVNAAGQWYSCFVAPNKKVDFTPYSKMRVRARTLALGTGDSGYGVVGIQASDTITSSVTASQQFDIYSNQGFIEFNLDVTNVNGNYYPAVYVHASKHWRSPFEVAFEQIWLE